MWQRALCDEEDRWLADGKLCCPPAGLGYYAREMRLRGCGQSPADGLVACHARGWSVDATALAIPASSKKVPQRKSIHRCDFCTVEFLRRPCGYWPFPYIGQCEDLDPWTITSARQNVEPDRTSGP
jgi:hypothetical protein